ncbi:hypothetical protein SLA2020_144800 [Shorea laevis]
MIEGKRDWIKSSFKMVIGEGAKVSFWRDAWIGSCSLDGLFSQLFSLSTDTQGTVQQMGEWIDETWRWRLRRRRRLLAWEQEQETQLHDIKHKVQLRRDVEDRWWWRFEKDGKYIVKSTYKILTVAEDWDEDRDLKRC